MPNRRHARPLRARPSATPSATLFLPPRPLAERERGTGLVGRIGRRSVAGLVAGLAVAIVVPILFAALGPAGTTLQPLGGEVKGAAPRASEQATGGSAAATVVDPRLAQVAANDADGPVSAANRKATPAEWLTGYTWPIRYGRITLPFKAIPGGEFINDGKLFHDGVDMASFCGAPVGAAHAGVVLAAGRRFDDQIGWIGDLTPYYRQLDVRQSWGQLPNVVVIDDGNGYRSMYAHFADVTVRPGQRVRAGQLIGHEGATGHASGCHVHYGLFSPLETKTFGVRPDILRHMKLPTLEIARIDPLLVLPGGDVALRTRSIAKAIAAATAAAPIAGSAAGGVAELQTIRR
ncbi:MAG TPA: M23 family metallopeptidase [Candidatus Limnocylindrales bacterium]|nr:M23 family metallopeptidase [Candidatus Limnocylindrales bacterium]